MNDRWYALKVRPRFEQFVADRLRQNGHEVFLPTYRIRAISSDCTKTLSVLLFPEYVFCRFDNRYRFSILAMQGVNSMAPQAHVMPADEFEVNALRRVLESGLRTRPALHPTPGNLVYIDDGPLRGLIGFAEKRNHQDWLLLPITVLQRCVAVEIDGQWIAPLGASLCGLDKEASGS